MLSIAIPMISGQTIWSEPKDALAEARLDDPAQVSMELDARQCPVDRAYGTDVQALRCRGRLPHRNGLNPSDAAS